MVVCNLGCHVGIECSLELILLNWILMKSMRMMMTHIFRTFCTYVFGVSAFPLHFHCWKMIKYISLISSALCVYQFIGVCAFFQAHCPMNCQRILLVFQIFFFLICVSWLEISPLDNLSSSSLCLGVCSILLEEKKCPPR